MWDARQSRGRGPTLSTLPHAGCHPHPHSHIPFRMISTLQRPVLREPACWLPVFFFFLSARVPGRDTLSLRASTGRTESCPCGMFLAGTHASHNVTLAFRLPHVNLNLLSPLALLPTSPCPRLSHVSNPLVEPYLSLKLKDRTPVLLILLTYFHLVRRLFFF